MSDYAKVDYIAAQGELAVLAMEHPEPGTVKLVCPLCRGGEKGQASLALTTFEEGRGYAWCCHRASCGFAGRGGPRWGVPDVPVARPTFVAKPYPYETVRPTSDTVSEAWVTKLRRAFGAYWEAGAARSGIVVRAFDERELVFTNRDWTGLRTGRVSKRLDDDGSKTVRTWRESPGPVYHWAGRPGGAQLEKQIWLVEDHLSAARLALANEPALCLCGTALPGDLCKVLTQVAPQARYLVALDPDASEDSLAQALRLRREFGLDAWPVFLREDIKDLRSSDFLQLLERNP